MATVPSGSTVHNTTVPQNSELDVYGSAYASQVEANGLLVVYAGGYVSGTVVSAAGEQDVSSGGTDVGTTVQGNGYEVVYGGSVTSALVTGVGADQQVYGGAVLDAMVVSRGEQEVNGGTVTSTTVGNGAYEYVGGGIADDTVVQTGGYAVISGGSLSGTTVEAGGTERITSQGLTSATTVQTGGQIDLTYLAFASGGTTALSDDDVLSVTVGGRTATISLSGMYSATDFLLSRDQTGGTLVTDNPCLCPGTLILTDRGEVPVEALAAGDRVITASGSAEPVCWVGRRHLFGRHLASRPDLQPVLIRQSALGPGLPRRDLMVSPEHAMFLDGVLVPARHLVNGTSVVQPGRARSISYYHVELARHDLILAEGAATETYVDDANRAMFANAGEAPGRDRRVAPQAHCAPRVESGFRLDAIRRRIASLPAAASGPSPVPPPGRPPAPDVRACA